MWDWNIIEKEGKFYQRACPRQKLSHSKGFEVQLENGESVAVFLLPDGRIKAFSNFCLHLKIPTLADGYIDQQARTVECPYHGWKYSLEDGRLKEGHACLKQFDTIVYNGWVYVELQEEQSDNSW